MLPLAIALLALGIVALFAGGEALVRGGADVARRLGLSPLVIGLTVVGFGTSMPELVVSVDAGLRGAPAIAVGNVVGSNTANVLLIVGLTALIAPIRAAGRSLARDLTVMNASALVLLPAFALGGLGRWTGVVLLAALGWYLVSVLRGGRDRTHAGNAVAGNAVAGNAVAGNAVARRAPQRSVGGAALRVVLGLVALVVGARLVVDGALSVVGAFGLSEAFVGLSIVAIGTSLPELATSLVAAYRREPAIALGNVVGSNVFNVLGILGVTALVTPVPVTSRFLTLDLPVMIAASAALTGLVLMRSVIGRGAGAVLVACYVAYLWLTGG